MTTCTPDYLHEDLVECERPERPWKAETGPRVCKPSCFDTWLLDGQRCEAERDLTWRRLPGLPLDWGRFRAAVWPPVQLRCPVGFPRCRPHPPKPRKTSARAALAMNVGFVILLMMSSYRIARLERLVRDLSAERRSGG